MSPTTRILSLCVVVCSAAACLYGQGGAYGTILGTVRDNSGAVVVAAGVDVSNVATNVTKHTRQLRRATTPCRTFSREPIA